MTPQQQQPSTMSQKVQFTLKLFMLETARSKLEQELSNFIKKAYEEVQGFLNTSFPTSVFSDLTKALDTKYEVIDKLSASLKSLTVEPQVCGQLITKPAAVQQDDIKHGINRATTTPSSHLEEEKERAVVLDEKRPTDAVSLPPASQRPEINPERPPILLPPLQASFPGISNTNPMKITPLMSWGCKDDFQVKHQKQTSSQLLHFLREKAKNVGVLEITVMDWSKSTLSSPERPAIKTQSNQFRQVVTDDLTNPLEPKTVFADMENQAPVFRVKGVEADGSLTYTCVIATKTELWDVVDIFTEVGRGDLKAIPFENKDCPNITPQVEHNCLNAQGENQSLQSTDPKHVSHFDGVQTLAMKCITIPEFQTCRFEEMKVVVSHIVSPGNFYVQHADSIIKWQTLVPDSWKASRSYAAQNCIPDIGTQVIGWFPKQEQWCRTRVTKICGVSEGRGTSIKVEVKRLDQGDTACLSLSDIKELTPEMAVLPLQAVQVSLANVTPVNGSDWSEEAVVWFRDMVENRTLYARLYPQGPKVTVELFLEKGRLRAMRRGASLSLRLAQNGHAIHSKLKNVCLMKISQDKVKKQDS
ncbi:uncharacterized protein isoform X2 [Notothenia coriiceps]|uniref:Uncharacterized protein isoform X2 n=1 Tax=Notothenia coriiceps TaxID=8208 RepID=A0A6I9PCF9_9TELE|nr:PREDICTED: uncharacterized protein LOC104959289 isoform X2 [Notothenia coriiceps]